MSNATQSLELTTAELNAMFQALTNELDRTPRANHKTRATLQNSLSKVLELTDLCQDGIVIVERIG